MSDTKKQAILAALDAFTAQRAGMDPGNYGSWKDYRAEARSVTRDLHDYRALSRYVALRDSITGDMLQAAFRAFSGRLSCTVMPHQYAPDTCPGIPCGVECDHLGAPWTVRLEYVTGQYFPTEYRKAACAVLSSAIWDWTRDQCMPKGTLVHNSETGETFERYNGKRAGDWLRDTFRKEFGRHLSARYFD